jgi:hypothetical protein
MSNRELAKHIARGIFAVGDDPNRPATRIQYMSCVKPGTGEFAGGGLCESSLVGLIERLLKTSPNTGDRQ